MRVCLFEDRTSFLEPLSLTRPVFDLLCGQTRLADKLWRLFPKCQTGVLVRPYLVDLYHAQHPGLRVNDLNWLHADTTLLLNGRWLPPPQNPALAGAEPCVGLIGDEVAYAVVDPKRLQFCTPATLESCLESWKATLPRRPAGGDLIHHPWDLVEWNTRQLWLDFQDLSARRRAGPSPSNLALVGPAERLWVDPTARIDPYVVADTTQGPVVIADEALITSFTRLEGPCYIGPKTQVHGAKIRAGTTLGPQCRIGGEVEASIVHGHSNKYHEGFLGHSYVGEWVNLGAGTHTCDLRNDYAPVAVPLAGQTIQTGLTKVGAFLGDHTKTGLSTLLNTGTTVGIFGQLLPAGPLVPKYVPSFTSWWNGKLRESSDWSRLMATAQHVLHRRGCTLTEAHQAVFDHIYEVTAADRRKTLQEMEQRQWRRSA